MSVINISSASSATNTIIYNFYTCPTIYDTNNIATNVFSNTTSGYLSIKNYPYNGNAAHLMHDIAGGSLMQFIVNEVRVLSPVHSIDGTTYSGEIVIELSSVNQDDDYITYFCIPIQGGAASAGDLDNLIQLNSASMAASISLNKIIPSQSTSYFYTSNATTSIFGNGTSTQTAVYVIVLGNPITVTSDTTAYIASNYTYAPYANITSQTSSSTGTVYNSTSNINGPDAITDANIYIDCNPTADIEAQAAESADAAPQKNEYKLDVKDLKEIFIYIGSWFVVVTIFILMNNYGLQLFKEKTDQEEYEKSPIITIFGFLNKMFYLKVPNTKKLKVITVILLMCFITSVVLYFYSLYTRKILYFKVFIHIITFIFSMILIMNLHLSINPNNPMSGVSTDGT